MPSLMFLLFLHPDSRPLVSLLPCCLKYKIINGWWITDFHYKDNNVFRVPDYSLKINNKYEEINAESIVGSKSNHLKHYNHQSN